MDVEALGRMETFAKEALKLTPEDREAFFCHAVKSGLMTEEQAQGLATYVCYFRMFTDRRYYNAVRDAVCEMFLSETRK